MGPRKKLKPNHKAEAQVESQAVNKPTEAESQTQRSATTSFKEAAWSVPIPSGTANAASDGPSTPQSGKTWYTGSWPRKATPVTQVAKESISAAGGVAPEAVASARAHTAQFSSTPLKSPALYLQRSVASSSRSLPLAAATLKLNVASNAPNPIQDAPSEREPMSGDTAGREQQPKPGVEDTPIVEKVEAHTSDRTDLTGSDMRKEAKQKPPDRAKSNRDSAGWFNWFSRTESFEDITKSSTTYNQSKKGNGSKDLLRDTSTEVSQNGDKALPKPRRNSEPSPVSPIKQQEPPSRSWLGLWGNATAQAQNSESLGTDRVVTNRSSDQPTQKPGLAKPTQGTTPQPTPPPAGVGKSYGWAFWSKDRSEGDRCKSATANEEGEIAQAGSLSQTRPEKTSVDESRGAPDKVEKRHGPLSLDQNGNIKRFQSVDETGKNHITTTLPSPTPKSKSAAEKSLKAKRENLVLPLLKRTYSFDGRPGFIQQLGRLFQLGSPPDVKHVKIASSPHRIKKALAIGIHGYFPAPLIRSVLGQPTGTSIRFANNAAKAIEKWTQDQGYSCEIEKVALEGEGKIAERTNLLWDLMLNWIEKIRTADFVMIACHSQGVPVAIMLVKKLIAMGCVGTTKIGICAMAGVNLGPFADYKSRWISGSAGELFEFAWPNSQVSKDYEEALHVALKFGVKLVYIGSIDDQLVSLESSTFGTVSHPYIYRAVFIDGRIHAPDFLTHLVGFALKLRNLGISDHGMIRELSTPLAGSLYTGEGHSRIYDDEAVYYLAIEYALETTDLGIIPMQVHHENPTLPQNPYILPFAMRGVLEEEYVRTELYGEITELIEQFDSWKPSSKVLKDVKFRLEGVRSKL